jgi:hypothetical protein
MHYYQKRSRTAIGCEVCSVCVSIRNRRCYWTQIGLRFCEQSSEIDDIYVCIHVLFVGVFVSVAFFVDR